MHTFLLFAVSTPAFATDVLYQGNVRGGVAVDASGVDVSELADGAVGYGDDFQIVIPTTAIVTDAFVILHAKPDGITSTPENIFINGWPLSEGALISASEATEIYRLTTPSAFGIAGTGVYTYSEQGSVEDDYHFGPGIHGASLVVVYEDFSLNGYRHVVVATDNVTDGDLPLRDLATNTIDSAVISYGLVNECARDQSNAVVIESYMVSTTAGGSDDGSSYSGTCGGQDWNTLLTQGSFGIDDLDTIVGVSGDILDGVPADGDSFNSRLDDELYQALYDRDGELTLGYSDSSGDDSQLSLVVAVIEIDSDSDGFADSVDNCPDDANPDQVDSDGDGMGDACEGCVDIDGDGYGLEGITETCVFPDGVDCNDDDPLIHSGADEIWYDGVDQNCDGDNDFDQDGDGYTSADFGGEDCDDLNDLTHPGAAEIWYNGVDNDCDDGCDFDQDDDACPVSEYYLEAATDPACDMGCFDGLDLEEADASDSESETGDDELDCGDEACDPSGTEYFGGDCDDEDADRLPGNPEIWYDGTDQDCDGNDDDQDGDGEGTVALGGTDCDDLDPLINSEAEEIWYNGIDENCDGNDADQDGDGEDAEPMGADCDDLNPWVNSTASEVWYDDVDDNCDGNMHDQDGDGEEAIPAGLDCDDLNYRVYSTADEVWYDGVDQDCSGTSDFDQDEDGHDRRPEGDDCDDLDPGVNPSAEEIWGDSIDQDCDGIAYRDTDEDGSPDHIDCDPDDASVFPEASEKCDYIDSDCDGDLVDHFPDTDGDGVPECDGILDVGGDSFELKEPESSGGCSVMASRSPTGWAWLVLIAMSCCRRGRRYQ